MGKHLCFFILLATGCCAQVEFTAFPKPLHFFPRDSGGFGHFTVAGTRTDSTVRKIRIIIAAQTDSALVIDTMITLWGESFSARARVPARLAEHRLLVAAVDAGGKETPVAEVAGLVAGDVYFTSGQSNAESPAGTGDARMLDSLYSLSFNRAVGFNYSWAMKNGKTVDEDGTFLRPSSLYWANEGTGFTGIWPLKLQHDLSLSAGIPICMLNGAQGASSIRQHQASRTPSDPANLRDGTGGGDAVLYDRLYAKIRRAGLLSGVRGIFWYQGESDGLSFETAEAYPAEFERLRASWKSDYPALERIFLLQLNTGCGGDYLDLMRQKQADIAWAYDDVLIMSTVGSLAEERSEDGCHYSVRGYEAIAGKLRPLVEKYIYKAALDESAILPPRLLDAVVTGPALITLKFDLEVSADAEMKYVLQNKSAQLRDYFFDEKNERLPVANVRAAGSRVFLQLFHGSRFPALISYLPDIFADHSGVYVGPWILNARNPSIGALSFYSRPVTYPAGHGDPILCPNPAVSTLSIVSAEPIKDIVIYSCDGRMVFRSAGAMEYDLSELPAGLYAVTISYAGRIVTKKLLKE